MNGALAADFFLDFGDDDFPFRIPFKKCLKNVVFPLWRRNPVLELQIGAICGAVVRSSSIVLAIQCLQIAVEWLRQGSSLQQLHAFNS